ncbi:hypothetical protein [Anaeromyxobacter terrae]|uniref:hypothetical protein n=1 Tax=Anaeromyxobacter terrae TaxID=2925406 RepID=UPI001F5A1388|nr:hypothetical protein [Anaeromyxobacter sp. SG22]
MYLAALSGVAAWLPWVRASGLGAPAWAEAIGLDHPFSSLAFLAGVGALFASTLACTWGRRSRIAARARGALPVGSIELEGAPAEQLRAFLRARGFRGEGPVLRRHAAALWAGWVLHVGLLVLVAGVGVQQAFHDGANFELAEGETARLDGPGAVFQRERGPLAPRDAPALEATLLAFDPYLRQEGYAPDRRSRVLLRAGAGPGRVLDLDRAEGTRIEGVDVYQAIPTGYALLLDVAGQGIRSVHLHADGPRRATAEVAAPGGAPMRFVLEAERGLDDRSGAGAISVRMGSAAGEAALGIGAPFAFGLAPARLVAVDRWAGFTYERSPGMPAVLAGFAVVLAGCVLLVFPAGVARIEHEGGRDVARVWVSRGGDVLADEWRSERDGGGGA